MNEETKHYWTEADKMGRVEQRLKLIECPECFLEINVDEDNLVLCEACLFSGCHNCFEKHECKMEGIKSEQN